MASSTLTLADIERLPKADLHVHLDGSLRLATVLDLAQQQGVALPGACSTEASLRPLVQMGEDCPSLVDYLKAFDITLSVLQTPQALARVARELVEDCARENVRYLEVRFCPLFHQQRGLSLPQVVQAVLEGLEEARELFPRTLTALILCGIRHESPETSLLLADLAVAFKGRGVVGFDLAGAEADFPAKRHKEAFGRVLAEDISCTLHAGEAYGAASVRQAIKHCGAHRIGHGVRLGEDPELLDLVKQQGIPLEMCPSSNVQTKAVQCLQQHPIRAFFDLGLQVTVNTDNRLITGTTLSRELLLLHEQLGFKPQEIQSLILMGFKSAFLPHPAKESLVKEVEQELSLLLPPTTTSH